MKLNQNKLWKVLKIVALVIVILSAFTMVNANSSSEMNIKGPVIGIDLGTSNSVVTITRDGKTTVIANNQGNRITPSVVHFGQKERFIGDSAKNLMSQYPKSTIYEAKRYIHVYSCCVIISLYDDSSKIIFPRLSV